MPIYEQLCPVCHQPHKIPRHCLIACEACAEKRRQAIRDKEALCSNKDINDFQSVDKGLPPWWLTCYRQFSSGKRIIKKSQEQG